ncbi:glycosyltransferase family 2 protein [Peribacillus sp. NPDC096447]|uniref:glycosyltransferase family 2 protein n=1 Tax=Peribacillus sp. NPDC096447 TaxID=3364394 RepID=UPI00381C44F0
MVTDNNIRIDILLATYNGQDYIDEQIKSLFLQTYDNWRLIIRDDGSTDSTINIINEYVKEYPEKISVIRDQDRNLGPARNFSRLLNNSLADYIMFCDQDDFWKPKKIEMSLEKMGYLEKKYSKKVPILVHTDLEVVDGNLNQLSESMFKYQQLNSENKKLNQLLTQNNVTGCTLMINKSLANICKPMPEDIIMHDWWLALNASAFGEIGFVNYSTIKYRQHGKNEVGAKGYSVSYFANKLKDLNKVCKSVTKGINQAEIFYKLNKDNLSNDQLHLLEKFIELPQKNRLRRLVSVYKNKITKQGIIRNLGFYFILIVLKRTI